MKNIAGEEELMEGIIPEIEERVQYKIVRNIIDALEEQFYPPEELMRPACPVCRQAGGRQGKLQVRFCEGH